MTTTTLELSEGRNSAGRRRRRAAESIMNAPRIPLLVATILTGLSAGIFYTFEASITLALAEVDDEIYVAAFQAINDTIRNPAFGIVFFGSIPAIGIALVMNWRSSPRIRWLIGAGLALYLVCFAVTAAGNVPLNNRLAEYASIDASSAAQARLEFESEWNRLNLIRTLAVTASFASLVVACAVAPTTAWPSDHDFSQEYSGSSGLVSN